MRIAVVGSGISGLGAAHAALARPRRECLRARRAAPAGTRTRSSHDGLALDTGFLVHNMRNYPLLARLFRELGVRTQESDMSFSVSCAAAASSTRAGARSRSDGTRRALASGLLGRSAAGSGPRGARWTSATTSSTRSAEYLDEHRYSQRFRRHFLVPLTSALWSTAPGRALDFPAAYAIRFFDNHGMLGFGRFRWRTVTRRQPTLMSTRSRRGSAAAPPRARRALPPARRGRRRAADRRRERALRQGRRRRPTPTRRSRCSRIRRRTSARAARTVRATRGTTPSSTPTRASCRGRARHAPSWNYRLGDDGRPTITYHLNRLQALDAERDYCLTLNERVPRRARARAILVRASALHRRDAASAAPAAATRRPAAHATSPAPTSATASTRTVSPERRRRRPALGVDW